VSASEARDVERVCPKCERATSGPEVMCPICKVRLVETAPAHGLIGAVIDGRFEVRALLGEGGMGTVYRAWQRSVDREVAIKVIDRTRVRDAMTVRRFLREAKLASQLSHPNTVNVIDFGQAEDGRLFIAMELVRGRTLSQAIAQDGAMALGRVIAIGVQLCDALEAAHDLAIVHRDLKPANVILVEDPARDRIKVLDFGLAKSLLGDDTEATRTGDLVGTPRYLAPELVRGAPVTPRSDLYAVGVILAELALGRKLFDGSLMAELWWQKASAPALPPDMPPALAPIIARVIDPEPAERPGSAAALRDELLALASDASTVSLARAAIAERAETATSAPSGASVAREAQLRAQLDEPTPHTAPVKLGAEGFGSARAAEPSGLVAPRSRRARVAIAVVAVGVLAGGVFAAAMRFGRGGDQPMEGSAGVASKAAPARVVTIDAASAPAPEAPAAGAAAAPGPASPPASPPVETVRPASHPLRHHGDHRAHDAAPRPEIGHTAATPTSSPPPASPPPASPPPPKREELPF